MTLHSFSPAVAGPRLQPRKHRRPAAAFIGFDELQVAASDGAPRAAMRELSATLFPSAYEFVILHRITGDNGYFCITFEGGRVGKICSRT